MGINTQHHMDMLMHYCLHVIQKRTQNVWWI